MNFTLIIRWFNGKISTVSAPSLHRAESILKRKKQIHGRIITFCIWESDAEGMTTKVRQGWK